MKFAMQQNFVRIEQPVNVNFFGWNFAQLLGWTAV